MKNLIIISLDCARRESLCCYNIPFRSMLHKKVGFFDFFGGGVIYFFCKPFLDFFIKKFIKPFTPAIDRVANDGILFVNAFTQAPYTPAAHASLFTGLNPYGHGIRRMIGLKLNDSAKTLAEVLKEKGYSTAGFLGSNALGKEYGLNRGFDIYDFSPNKLFVNFGEKSIYRRDCKDVTNNALNWLQKQDNDFFLFLHYFDAHEQDSNISLQPFWQIKKLSKIDNEIKRIISFLEKNSIYHNTAIIIIADHGNGFGEHGEDAHKEFLYDSTLRIPFIIKLDENYKEQKSSSMVSLIDIFPTVLQYLEVSAIDNHKAEGANILDIVKNESSYSDRMFYSETAFEKSTVYPDDLKNRHLALRTLKWKFIIETITGKRELYDMLNDPFELRDVSQAYPEITKEFFDHLSKILAADKDFNRNLMTEAELSSMKESLRSLGYL